VPAAAVIPAPIAYIKVAAVKTLVVELLLYETRQSSDSSMFLTAFFRSCKIERFCCVGSVTLNKLECFKQAFALNTPAWNNEKGLWFFLLVQEPE
jgi:hypothetical protein